MDFDKKAMADMNIKDSLMLLMIVAMSIMACGSKPNAKDAVLSKNKANQYIEQGRCDKAIKELHNVLKADEKDAGSYRLMAECFEKLGLPDSAIIYYEGAIVFQPDDREAYEHIADIYYESGDYHEAMAWYDRALQISYISSSSFTRLGIIHQSWHEYNLAGTYYHYAIAMDSSNSNALYGLGDIDLQQGDTASAIILFEKAVETGQNVGAAYDLAVIMQKRELYDEAISWLDKCIEFSDDPKFKEQIYQLKMGIIVKMKAGQK